MKEYPSDDFPIVGQVRGDPCPWCSKPLGEYPHVRAVSCGKFAGAEQEADVLAEEFSLVSRILGRKAGVFGEEPLHGALTRAEITVARLRRLYESTSLVPPGNVEGACMP